MVRLQKPKSMSTPFSYFDLIQVFRQSGCPICNLLLRDADRFLEGLLYEMATDPDIQDAFRSRRGLCNEHSWQLKRYLGYSLGIATLYRAALDEILKALDERPAEASLPSGLGRLFSGSAKHAGLPLAGKLAPESPCLVCDLLDRNERSYAQILSEHITSEVMQEAYRESDGLCLPHFRLVLQQPLDPERLERIIALQRAIWLKLQDDLDAFVRKRDYRFSHEPMGREGDSWSRAIASIAGEDGVFGVERRSGSATGQPSGASSQIRQEDEPTRGARFHRH